MKICIIMIGIGLVIRIIASIMMLRGGNWMDKPVWDVKTCTINELKHTLNEMEADGYEICRYEIMPESFFWAVIGHLNECK